MPVDERRKTMKEAYLAKLESQLKEWEESLEALRAKADEKLDIEGHLEDWRAKRDAARAKLDELKAESGERWDIVKMGVESAWAELKTAFETATAKGSAKSDKPAA
jgi:hypothetical protein